MVSINNQSIPRIQYLRNLFNKMNTLEKLQKQKIIEHNKHYENLFKSSLKRKSIFVFDSDSVVVDETGVGAPPFNVTSTKLSNFVTKHENINLGKYNGNPQFSTEHLIDYDANGMPDFIKNDTQNIWSNYKEGSTNYIHQLYKRRVALNQGKK